MQYIKWISWEDHQRTRGICDYLSIHPDIVNCHEKSIKRYLILLTKTYFILKGSQIRVLIVQNPSLVLTVFVFFLRYFFKYKLIVDAHNEAVQPYIHDNFLIRSISYFLLKHADLTIVTNNYLAEFVKEKGGNYFVLPDKIPVVECIKSITLPSDSFNLILIATYAADEPIIEIIDAANMLKNNITLYVTGNYTKLKKNYIEKLPKNIIFTGYLSNEDYWAYLKASDAIIDLTTMDNCLVCGAYEAVAMEKPLILSGNNASIEYFSKGVLFTDNTLEDIKNVMKSIVESREELAVDIKDLGESLSLDWRKKAKELKQSILKMIF